MSGMQLTTLACSLEERFREGVHVSVNGRRVHTFPQDVVQPWRIHTTLFLTDGVSARVLRSAGSREQVESDKEVKKLGSAKSGKRTKEDVAAIRSTRAGPSIQDPGPSPSSPVSPPSPCIRPKLYMQADDLKGALHGAGMTPGDILMVGVDPGKHEPIVAASCESFKPYTSKTCFFCNELRSAVAHDRMKRQLKDKNGNNVEREVRGLRVCNNQGCSARCLNRDLNAALNIGKRAWHLVRGEVPPNMDAVAAKVRDDPHMQVCASCDGSGV